MNKEEEQKKKIEEQVSQEIPYSKKKCIDMAFQEGKKQAIEEVIKIINKKINFIKSPDFVMVEKDQKYAELNRNRMVNILKYLQEEINKEKN